MALRIAVIGECWVTAALDPYEPDSTEGTYWHARHKLTAAARVLNEKLVSWRRKQPRDSPDQQDQAQRKHGCH